jgi:hypothetical protein
MLSIFLCTAGGEVPGTELSQSDREELFAHNGYQRIFRLYGHGKFRSRFQMTNVVLPRIGRNKWLLVDDRVEFRRRQTMRSLLVVVSYYCQNPALAPRVRWHQVVRTVVDHKLAIVFATVLDGERPDVGVVGQSVPKEF